MKKHYFILLICLLLLQINVSAQEEEDKKKRTIDFGSDIVSSYVWRGVLFDGALNLQPWLEASLGDFAIGAWGSYNTQGTYSEPDFYLSYRKNNFSITYTDFYSGSGIDFFNYESKETMHTGEIMLKYAGNEKFPLSLTASIMVFGYDKKVDENFPNGYDPDENNYSTYFELGYSHQTATKVNLDFFAGAIFQESHFYGTTGFGVINLGMKASKSMKINENYSLPVSMSLISNPQAERMFFVFGISL